MKAVLAVGFLGVCVLVAVVYQAFQQEFNIRTLKSQIASTTEQVKSKEDEIVKAKLKIQQVNDELMPLNKQRDELVKKKNELQKAKGDSEKALGTCQTQKVLNPHIVNYMVLDDPSHRQFETDSGKKKTDATAALEKIKADQVAEEQKIQEELQNLQKQILERDVKICEFVDEGKEEGRKLCESKKAAQ
ncbi:hypothetical protein NFI96_017304 [Prochilodus magdalenae]|nr:hypothetical protein NFI96_017304 [Prochilodus magdalenae]